MVGDKIYFKNGYCYLLYFYDIGFSTKQLLVIANHFGIFPKINGVIDFLEIISLRLMN